VFSFLLEVLSRGPHKGFFDLSPSGHKAGKKKRAGKDGEKPVMVPLVPEGKRLLG
jgi:hypothetical protein